MTKFLVAATLLGCRSEAEPEPALAEELTARTSSTVAADEAPDEEEDKPEDSGGAGAAMTLEEGAMGRPGGRYTREQAIEQARAAGILGSVKTAPGGMASLTGKGNVTSGMADPNIGSAERSRDWGKNKWTVTAQDRVSTFAADVDTASYTMGRRAFKEGRMPEPASVRVEEWVNYFKYELPAPMANTPFAVVMDAAPSPLTPGRHVVRVAVATKPKPKTERAPANLVFLVDVSGSMDGEDRLPLARKSLKVLLENLDDRDSVALVTYAGETRLVLPATSLRERSRIRAAIDDLRAGGSTAMASGIGLAYREAAKGLKPGVTSRVVVLSDGDANVGPNSPDEILKIIAGHAKEGVTLSTIGFGVGNYRDTLMEQLANKGNGNNYYVDDIEAARRVFSEDVVATLEVVAKDVKLQVEFDPAMVTKYRLVGYENRDVADKDFRNDKVDAGEIGSGHQVTAIYEVELTAAGQQVAAPIGGVRIRHKTPRGEQATEAAFPMVGGPAATFAAASADFRFAFAVAAFADVLRGAEDAKKWSLGKIFELAKAAAGDDRDRKHLVELLVAAIDLKRTS